MTQEEAITAIELLRQEIAQPVWVDPEVVHMPIDGNQINRENLSTDLRSGHMWKSSSKES